MAEVALVPAASSVLKVLKAVKGICAAVATDRRNQKDYRGIMMCVDRVRTILFGFQGARELATQAVMTRALDDLAGSLDEALEIIQRCQGRRSKIHRLVVARETAKDLRRVEKDIDQKLQTAIFAGVMQMTLTNASISTKNFVQQRHQVSMILIKIDRRECELCYKQIHWTLCKIQAKGMIESICFDAAINNVFIVGLFDPEKLLRKIVCRAREVVKEIQIVKKKDKDDDEEDDVQDEQEEDEEDEEDYQKEEEPNVVEDEDYHNEEEPDVVEDEDRLPISAQNYRTTTRNEDGCHASMVSEGPWSPPALLVWSEASSHTSFSLAIPQDMTLRDDTKLSAAVSDLLRPRKNPSMIQEDCHGGYPSVCVTNYRTRDEALAPFCQQLDEGNGKPAIASHPKRTKCPLGYKDVLILVQATVIISLMWYLM